MFSKEFFYDWEGANTSLFFLINQLHHFEFLDRIMLIFTKIGYFNAFPIYFLLLLIYALYIFKKDPSQKSFWLQVICSTFISVGMAALLVILVKIYFNYQRPFCALHISKQLLTRLIQDYLSSLKCHHSFPSGHAAFSVTMAANLFWIGKTPWKIFCVSFALLVITSRIYLYAHFPADVLTGLGVGLFTSWMGYLIASYLINIVHHKLEKS